MLNAGLPRVHDMKLSILTLCALLEMNGNLIPEHLREGWASLLPGALSIFKTLPAAIASEFMHQRNSITLTIMCRP